MSSHDALALRIGKLEAEGDIRRLKTAYAELCDAGYPGEKLGALFTEDAVWDGGEHFGVYTGRAEIEDVLRCGLGRRHLGAALHGRSPRSPSPTTSRRRPAPGICGRRAPK